MSSTMSTFSISQYPYHYNTAAAAVAPAPQHTPMRQYSGYGTSSAFSSSANPDEDWTKISDLAERRRIQNRIAQRNYRKKLKRRLEDLERRAGSSDEGESDKPSPSKANSQTSSKSPNANAQSTRRHSSSAKVQKSRTSSQSAPTSHGQFTPPMESQEKVFLPSRPEDSTPIFSYGAYPSEDLLMNPYAPTQNYPDINVAGQYPSYVAPASISSPLPSLQHFQDAAAVNIKRETYSSDDGMGFLNNYGCAPTFDMSIPSSFDQHSAPHTPLSQPFDHSASCSDSGFDYPYAPLSPPGSPSLLQLNPNSQR